MRRDETVDELIDRLAAPKHRLDRRGQVPAWAKLLAVGAVAFVAGVIAAWWWSL